MNETKSLNPITRFLDAYGPYGFGVAALLLIWFTIVAPELERSKTDYTEFNKGAKLMNDTSNTLETTARVMERTASKLEIITQIQSGTKDE